jgi:CRP/FNR family transcriptional regulator
MNDSSNVGSARSSVSLAAVAELLGMQPPSGAMVADQRFAVRRLRRGEAVHREGDSFRSLYVVRAGAFKTTATKGNGTEQVLAFPVPGDVVGLDGVASNTYRTSTIALGPSEAIVMPYAQLEEVFGTDPAFAGALYHEFSRGIAQRLQTISVLSTRGAHLRVAAFLLRIAERLGGPSAEPRRVTLCMRRQEIGSHLCLRLETVCRALTRLADAGLITVRYRSVTILDPEGLRRLARQAGSRTRSGAPAVVPKATAPTQAADPYASTTPSVLTSAEPRHPSSSVGVDARRPARSASGKDRRPDRVELEPIA